MKLFNLRNLFAQKDLPVVAVPAEPAAVASPPVPVRHWRDLFPAPAVPQQPLPAADSGERPLMAAGAGEENELLVLKTAAQGTTTEMLAAPRIEILPRVGKKTAEPAVSPPDPAASPFKVVPALTPEAMQRMREEYADRKERRRLEAEAEAAAEGQPEEMVARLLVLERMKVREAEARVIEMESRARLAEARVEELEFAMEELRAVLGRKDEAYDFAHKCAQQVEEKLKASDDACDALRRLAQDRGEEIQMLKEFEAIYLTRIEDWKVVSQR